MGNSQTHQGMPDPSEDTPRNPEKPITKFGLGDPLVGKGYAAPQPQPDPSQGLPAPYGVAPVNSMPYDLQEQIRELGVWANGNEADSKSDFRAYWIQKLPALIGSAGSPVLVYYNLHAFGIILGAIAALGILIDGIWPRGMLRNVHHRVFLDVRHLMNKLVADWRVGSADLPNGDKGQKLAAAIIRDAQPEIARINRYLSDAETAMNTASTHLPPPAQTHPPAPSAPSKTEPKG